MKTNRAVTLLAALTTLTGLLGCDQKVDKGDDKLTEGNQSIEVVYYDSSETVLFDNLETLYLFNDSPVVALDDIVMGSGMFVSIDDLWFNFVGTDGYSPLGNPNCVNDYVPTGAEWLSHGYIERGTRRILWEEELEVPQCLSVKDVETIYVADDPADLPTGGDADSDTDSDSDSDTDTDSDSDADGDLTIDYDGDTQDVSLSGLETVDIGGTQVVLLTTLFGETDFVFDLEDVMLSIEGSDGYNPVEEGTCTEALPAAGTLATQAGINPENNDIEWDPTLGFSGCAFVKDVAIIYVLPE